MRNRTGRQPVTIRGNVIPGVRQRVTKNGTVRFDMTLTVPNPNKPGRVMTTYVALDASTARAAVMEAEARRAAYRAGKPLEESVTLPDEVDFPTLGEVLDDYLLDLEERAALGECSPRSPQAAREKGAHLGALRSLRFDRVTDEDVRVWLRSMAKQGYSDSTRLASMNLISTVYGWHRPKIDNPVAALRKSDRPQPRRKTNPRPTAEQVAAMVAAVPEHRRIAVALGAYTGLRANEIVALTWGDIKQHGSEIRFSHIVVSAQLHQGERRPTKCASMDDESRVVPVLPELEPILSAHFQEATENGCGADDDFVLQGNGANGSYAYGNVNRHAKKAALEVGIEGNMTGHALRGAFASLALDRGVPLAQVASSLGHSNPATTLAYYAGEVERKDAAKAQAFAEAWEGAAP